MKIKIITFVLLLTFSIVSSAFAQNKTATPTNVVSQQQIDELKNKIASKVAELKLVEKRGIIGTVTDSSDTQITLTGINGSVKIVDVDELTKFFSSSQTFGISDIKKGQTLGILGLFNKESRRILAREINSISSTQKIILGVVTNIDAKNFELTLKKENGTKYTLVIEDITKTLSLSDSFVKSGFSKIALQQTLIATGLPDKQGTGKIIASRIIILPDIKLKNEKTDTNAPVIIPASGSGIRLEPKNSK